MQFSKYLLVKHFSRPEEMAEFIGELTALSED